MFRNSVVEFVRAHDRQTGPARWCVLGKGPTSDGFDPCEWRCDNVVTLNHAVRLPRDEPTLAHFVDVEAYLDCAADMSPTQRVAMPWHPHVGMKPTVRTLVDFFRDCDHLRRAFLAGRLFSYNASNHHRFIKNRHLPVVRLRYFSAVAVFNFLAAAGVAVIYSLGVDGGTGYGRAFDPKDRLANGRRSFSDQDAEIERVVRTFGVRHVPGREILRPG